jgi:hypothetical protein
MISAISDRMLLLFLLLLFFLLLFLVVNMCPMLTILQWPIVISSSSPGDNNGTVRNLRCPTHIRFETSSIKPAPRTNKTIIVYED